MKHILATAFVMLAFFGLGVLAQWQKTPPSPIPPVAYAQFCGNIVVVETAKTAMFEQFEAQGCNDVHFVDLGDGYWLAYGVKTVREWQ